jgi:hypothetical protein
MARISAVLPRHLGRRSLDDSGGPSGRGSVFHTVYAYGDIYRTVLGCCATPSYTEEAYNAKAPASTVEDDTKATAVGLGALFWLLVIGLVVVVLFAYAASTPRVAV